jgi:hypothetical protein
MSFSNMIQDAVEGALSGHNNNNNRDSNRHDNNSNDNRDDNDNEFNPAARYAESHTNTSSGDTSLFTSALSFLNENKHRLASSDINEQEMIQAHQSVYGGDSNNEPRQHDANSVGAGAAMQALKMFTTSSEGEKSGMDKNAFIGMAMAQAKKMFEEKEARGEVVCFPSLSQLFFPNGRMMMC